MKFIIVSAVYNMSAHLKKNIDILKSQTYTNFEVYFGNDLSTDDSCEVIEKNIKDDERFHLIRHKEKLYSMGNIAETIKLVNPNDDDVIVLVDGDDVLADSTTLEYLASVYQKEKCWMTFGSYTVNEKRVTKNCSDYPVWVKRFNLFRYVRWRANHLKTFKYSLWKHVKPESLTLTEKELKRVSTNQLFTGRVRNWLEFRKIKLADLVTNDGRYIRRCSDKYLTSPLLDMAGEKAIFIDKVLYRYLGTHADGDHNFGDSNKKWSQRLLRSAVTLKPRYKKR